MYKIIPSRLKVNIVIPTLNEVENIGNIIHRLKKMGYHNILIIDGHSKDGTAEYAKKLGAKVMMQNGYGKGDALREALKCSCLDGDVIVIMDADGSMAPEELPLYTNAIKNGAQIVKGSRFLTLGQSEDLTLLRRIGNMVMTKILNLLFFATYTDLCYGFIAFKKDALVTLLPNLTSTGFEIETEICIKSKTFGFKVVEVPSIERVRVYGTSNLNTITDGYKILLTLLKEVLRIN